MNKKTPDTAGKAQRAALARSARLVLRGWDALGEGERRSVGEALRDLFFAGHRGEGGPADGVGRALIAAVRPAPVAQVDGLDVSFFPGGRFCKVRFVDEKRVAAALRPLFARPSAGEPSLLAVFVDPREFSFRTYENLIPLDRYFSRAAGSLSLGAPRPLGLERAWSLPIEASPALRGALLGLDGLGLHVPPLDPSARGGERFLFHAAGLAALLTRAVREALGDALEGPGVFSHVNPVFRCNRFEPGDERFHRHLDNPYFDRDRRHISRYTLLLYLTGGEGAPALRLGAREVASIDPMTCVLFDQRIEHEGSPYLDGRKVFVRTELIFELDEVADRPAAGPIFARACYFTGESLLDPALTRLTNEHYNRAAAAHWGGDPQSSSEALMLKEFNGVRFAANGYDFWFARGPLTLPQCAAIALLDFFNARVDGRPFRSLCRSKAVEGGSVEQVEGLLLSPEFEADQAFAPLDLERMMPPPPRPDDNICCSYHYDNYHQFPETIERYREARAFACERLAGAPVALMGQQILLDPSRFIVGESRIHVLSSAALEPVHFAACQNSTIAGDVLIGVKTRLDALQPLVPPILFAEHGGCYRLMFDFFRNSWMVESNEQIVPIPELIEGLREPEVWGAYPWVEATDEAPREGDRRGLAGSRWWLGAPVWVEHEGRRVDAADPAVDPDLLDELLASRDRCARVAAAANPNLPSGSLSRLLLPERDSHGVFDRGEEHVAAWWNPSVAMLILQEPDPGHAGCADQVLMWLEHLHGLRKLPVGQALESRVGDWERDDAPPPGCAEAHRVVREFALHLGDLLGLRAPPDDEAWYEFEG